MGRRPLQPGGASTGGGCTPTRRRLFERLGVRLDPGRISRGLSIADQQIVEIAKALSLDARVIVMDEPTAALSPPRWPGCSTSCARCARPAPRCCSSPTGSKRCSRSASGSP